MRAPSRAQVPRRSAVATLVAAALIVPSAPVASGEPAKAAQVPVALAWGSDQTLLVALREGRRVVRVDPRNWTVSGGWDLPIRPISMAMNCDGARVLVGGA